MSSSPQHLVVRMMKRPHGDVVPGEDLVVQSEKAPLASDLRSGEILLRRLYLSLDPAMRGWMRDVPSYVPPVQVGAIMRGGTVNEVVASRHPRFHIGDVVLDQSMNGGWSEMAVSNGLGCKILDPNPALPLSAYLGALGGTGMTAYFGLLRIGKPKSGDVVLVSAAAGATGSIVCQIAKIKGCTVVGIAGGREKCQWLRDEIGVDDAIDYKAAKGSPERFQKLLRKSLKNVHAKGFDVFFDNVGGFILDESLRRLSMRARVVVCGAIR